MSASSASSHGKRIFLVSSCLVGLRTRYDGKCVEENTLPAELAGAVLIPVCPEQLGGLSTPRIAAEIVGGSGADVLGGNAKVISKDGIDVSEQFIRGAGEVLKIARLQKIDAVILKAGSPSCGFGNILGVTAALLNENGYEVREYEEFSG